MEGDGECKDEVVVLGVSPVVAVAVVAVGVDVHLVGGQLLDQERGVRQVCRNLEPLALEGDLGCGDEVAFGEGNRCQSRLPWRLQTGG